MVSAARVNERGQLAAQHPRPSVACRSLLLALGPSTRAEPRLKVIQSFWASVENLLGIIQIGLQWFSFNSPSVCFARL